MVVGILAGVYFGVPPNVMKWESDLCRTEFC